ncbi:hypothetical protein QC762_0086850 [Podospora pseudocomata]|uniref:Uncharacterized protein n=1 Tax=Podospora pseudocomata TaxID=2093779 RepID=A0ABR0GDF6_9PEZI|nr:hypothetical protein QC762_0086850 [Podospora pseudocomata]
MTLCMDRRASGGSARLRVRDKLPFPPRRLGTYLAFGCISFMMRRLTGTYEGSRTMGATA